MTPYHAVVAIDHRSAKVLAFDATQRVVQNFHLHYPARARHGSGARAGHAFFAQVCHSLMDVPEVLITGSHQNLADFRRYIETHRPHAMRHIAGYEVVDRPTDTQLVALARKYFAKRELMEGLLYSALSPQRETRVRPVSLT